MTIEVNSNFPVQTLRLVVASELQEVDSSEYLADKKVMLVGVPGAFTPTCHVSHLPGYIEHLSSFEAKGYSVVFISVNDPFVMKAWSEASNANGIDMIADGNGELTEALELVMDASGFGLGKRCMRFAMAIENSVIKSIDVEEGGALDVSSAESQLAKI
ncbi:peroxiredoxin [Gammaproteobacteria bacterium]|jgi:peroxiredoxin|nr:peroxiredoxin [Gammaproteobacteria bacterium]MDB4194510.1 peroxiredoxin [Gammaproteobacteria bacterium]MDB9900823.1 peroxiredoxin [Gammaproteobacteria bacterium]MDC0437184.1 peroxiredoxin [Gammaproteobacteria bacterium]MDC1164389.1 peroxiredoxin [Gammaproteobacteria bacterium]